MNSIASFEIKEENELIAVAKFILPYLIESKIVVFDGEMGAGKTTFIKYICKELGVTETVNSPTFSIVNEYLSSNQNFIYHFDFYRLNSEEEAYNIGVEEYFYSGNICLIEWASKIPNLLPDKYILVKIENNNSIRSIFVNQLT
jgi:tRNA threonylcarbamoyladenosine biosynthesis protein TsaE